MFIAAHSRQFQISLGLSAFAECLARLAVVLLLVLAALDWSIAVDRVEGSLLAIMLVAR